MNKVIQYFLRLKSQLFSPESPTGSIFKNMAFLAMGSGVARIISLLSTPLITRLYTPEDMGILSVFIGLTAVLIPFSSLKYSVALPLPKNDGIAVNILFLSFAILITVCALVTILLFFLATPLLSSLSMERMIPYWALGIVAVLGAGLYEILQNWATREKAFKPLAKTKVIQILGDSIVKIGLGLLGIKPIGLIYGNIIAQAGGVFTLMRILKERILQNVEYVSINRLFFVFRYFGDFPKYRLPSQFLLVLSSKAPILFSSSLFGLGVTGQIGLAFTIIAIPLSLFGQTTGQAYYAEIAKIGKKGGAEILLMSKQLFKKLLIISIIPFLFLFLFGPLIFKIAFGPQWVDAGLYARILSLYLVTQFISAPFIHIVNIFGHQKTFLFYNLQRLALIFLTISIVYFFHLNVLSFLWMFSVTLSTHYLIISLQLFKIIKRGK